MAADPTYPLLPIFALLSAALLLILLTTNFVRRSWNLGVSFLAFWLFWENLFYAINAIIWSDNGDLKLYALCDIATHVYVFTYIVKPACTLILTRRLYKIASLRSLIPENHRVRTVDMIIEWSLGLGLPTLVAGILYYIVQFSRFQVIEGYGCCATEDVSGVSILLIEAPGLILPLISLLFYCPKIILVFYRHSRDTNEFLRANGSVSRGGYSRILILGCLDIFLTLPVGILQLVSSIRGVLRNSVLPWYWGWDATHSNWDPLSASWRDIEQSGPWPTFNLYFARWNPVVLALAIFALFGFSAESRATYTRVMYAILKSFGWTAPESKHDDRSGVHFGIRSLISTRTRTQQSSFATFPEMRGFDVGEDLEQGVRFVINSSGIKAIGPVVGSGPSTTETVTICRAEDGGISGDNERLKLEDSNESMPNAQAKDLPHFESS